MFVPDPPEGWPVAPMAWMLLMPVWSVDVLLVRFVIIDPTEMHFVLLLRRVVTAAEGAGPDKRQAVRRPGADERVDEASWLRPAPP